ncbi:MAG: response regulator [Bacteroidales bacterium]|nr:response regulator [Bacteroidales bacterium]
MENTEVLPRVLVVDDQLQNRMLIAEYLDELEIDIDEAESGEECLEKLKHEDYTLIILDIQMPGLDGFEVLEAMRKVERTKDIPVVFISAIYDSEEYILKGISSGAIDFITKPINISILRSKVTNFLNLYEKQLKLDQLVKALEKTNDKLRESEQKFKKIAHTASDAIIVLDQKYKIRFWNEASQQIFGYSGTEINGEDFFNKLISGKSQSDLKKFFDALLKEKSLQQNSTLRIIGYNKEGSEFPVELSLAYFTAANNEINYTVIIRDITKQVNMEKEALKAKELRESNKTMKEFMDSVSHELRTPMNAILGISNMLLKYNNENLSDKQTEGLQIINQSGTRLLDMINDVLDLSRLDANRLKVVNERMNLDKFLASMHSMVLSLIGEKKIKFYIRKSINVGQYIFSDIKKLNQILTNLLGNAVKFTNEGKINLFIHYIDDKLYFEVSDTGIGINEEHLQDIFFKFKQIDNSASKKYQGTGLGLNICKKLVELLQGEIIAESRPGKGTTMKFYIPAEQLPSEINYKEEQIEQAESSDAIIRELNINKPLAVVLDDNKENRYWYANLLSVKGFEVIDYSDSCECLKAMKMLLPEILIMKYEMPKLHGETVLKEIGNNKNLNKMQVVLMSNADDLILKDIENNITVLNLPVTEKIYLESIKKQKISETKTECNDIVLFEGKSALKKYAENGIEYYRNDSFEMMIYLIAKRKIKNLILEGIDLMGENFKLVKWLCANGKHIPEKVIVVYTNQLFKAVVNEIIKIPEAFLIPLKDLLVYENLNTAIDSLSKVKT